MKTLSISKKKIGLGQRCFIIAEAGVNHNGSIRIAKKLIDAAQRAGADAVKFQTFKAHELVTRGAAKAHYQLKVGVRESHYEMLRGLELSEKKHILLKHYCKKKRIVFLSSPFDESSADLLQSLDVPAFKIASGEITNIPFLIHIAKMKKTIILSTGMSTMREVLYAVKALRHAGGNKIILLHCVSNYPADPKDANLRAMVTMAKVCRLPVGFSDHTLGVEVALAATAMGACVIEKHITLDRKMYGPDHSMSLEPTEFLKLVRGIRTVESALGHGRKQPAKSEANIAAVARKSLVAICEIPKGTKLKKKHIAIKRPGTGLAPAMFFCLLGRRARKTIRAGSLLNQGMLE